MKDSQVKIRATSNLKLSTSTGMNMDYSYPKNCPIDALAEGVMFAVFMNKGNEGFRVFCDNLADKFHKVTNQENEKKKCIVKNN